jgi:aconitase B
MNSTKNSAFPLCSFLQANSKVASTLSTILGRTPTLAEYQAAVEGIVLTKFKPSTKQLVKN